MNKEVKIVNVEEETQENDLSFLLDTTYPLLQEFREKCPGTFKHSQSVAGLSEAVGLSLGLDVNFLKVCALYHDLGKMCAPNFFSENQTEDNPHDSLEPWISAQIITRHVPDTVNLLLNNPDFNRDIIMVISQHHGNEILDYFYGKAPKDSDEEDFRYKCFCPDSVEAAILMISDHIEAKTRSLFQVGDFDTGEVIETTISKLIDLGQLDNVVMKLGDLKKIKIAIGKELEGSYQKRVSYDTDKETKKAE